MLCGYPAKFKIHWKSVSFNYSGKVSEGQLLFIIKCKTSILSSGIAVRLIGWSPAASLISRPCSIFLDRKHPASKCKMVIFMQFQPGRLECLVGRTYRMSGKSLLNKLLEITGSP